MFVRYLNQVGEVRKITTEKPAQRDVPENTKVKIVNNVHGKYLDFKTFKLKHSLLIQNFNLQYIVSKKNVGKAS